MKVSIKVEGLKECEDSLLELSAATGKNVLKRALISAARPIETDAERLAPKRTGRLQESITVSTTLTKSQRSAKGSLVEAYVGSTSSFAHLQEFGTAHHGPHPFLRPAIDASEKRVTDAFVGELRVELDKAKARAARKAARTLAKMKGI